MSGWSLPFLPALAITPIGARRGHALHRCRRRAQGHRRAVRVRPSYPVGRGGVGSLPTAGDRDGVDGREMRSSAAPRVTRARSWRPRGEGSPPGVAAAASSRRRHTSLLKFRDVPVRSVRKSVGAPGSTGTVVVLSGAQSLGPHPPISQDSLFHCMRRATAWTR